MNQYIENTSTSTRSASSPTADKSRTIGLICIALYCLTLISDGALRWFLNERGIAGVLYLRELLPAVAIGTAILSTSGNAFMLWRRLFVIVVGFFAFSFVWGFAHGIPALQGLFGAKTLMSIPVGVALAVLAEGRSVAIAGFSIAAGIIALVGVGVDYVLDLPWAGLHYELGDLRLEGQREWTIDSLARIAGFSRASYDVGSQMVVLSAIVLTCKFKGSVRALFVTAMLAGILLTTSRSSLAAFVALMFIYVGVRVCGPSAMRVTVVPILWAPVLVVALAYALPGTTDFIAALDRSGAGSTASWAMRTEGNWLESFAMLPSSPTLEWVFGLGVGSVGAAQKPLDPDFYMSPDNLFIYLLVSFGILGVLLVFLSMTFAWYRGLGRGSCSYSLLLPVVATAGIFITAAENVFLGLGLGLAIGQVALSRGKFLDSRPCSV